MSAGPPLEFIPPHLDAWVLNASRWLLPFWLHHQSRIGGIAVHHSARLTTAIERFETGNSRLLLAFRHPSIDDPAVMAHLLWVRHGCHAQFLYDRGIPLWAGKTIGWLLSRLGGISIQRGKLDLPALRHAREVLLHGAFPFAIAPEGATNGHNEQVSNLEPGIAQLAFWTAAALTSSGRKEQVEILPIGLQYFYETPVWETIEGLLSKLEKNAGLSPPPDRSNLLPEQLYGRLLRLQNVMLEILQDFYQQAYHQPAQPSAGGISSWAHSKAETAPSGSNSSGDLLSVDGRGERLVNTALGTLERSFGLPPNGTVAERCRRLEQAGWERIYPPSPHPSEEVVSPLRMGLTDRLAEETERRMWHMRMVEAFGAVNVTNLRERLSQERFADTLLLLWDTDCRIRGENPAERPRLGKRRAVISVDNPILISDWMEKYRIDRRQAVAELTGTLHHHLEALITPTGTGLAAGATRQSIVT